MIKKNMKNLNQNQNLQGVTIFDSNNRCLNAFDIIVSEECLRAAYQDLKSKPGMMVEGTDNITLDGINEEWFEKTSFELNREQYQFKPVRKVYIPKANGKMRPLGISSPRDRIIQQAMKLVMESVLEPRFSELSHGFRPKRGCHSALKEIRQWKGVAWFIEGDIKSFFDKINHNNLENLLNNHFKDARLIHLYWKLVKAGYVEWNTKKFVPSDMGVPQGGIISPLLSNLILHELVKFIEDRIKSLEIANGNNLPYIRNPVYHNLESKIHRLNKKILTKGNDPLDKLKLKLLLKERRMTKSTIPDPDFKLRIKYVRYADDWLIGVWGTRKDAESLKLEIRELLKELKLELSEEKTLITNARKERAKFLGTYIKKLWVKGNLFTKNTKARLRKRSPGGNLWMTAPILDIKKKLEKEGFIWVDKKGRLKAKAITKFITLPLWDLVIRYRTIYRGYINYYSFVDNIYLFNKFTEYLWVA
uniref:Reverse transcriptase n=1 Tax=Ophiostoma torulosum TaxID=96403 RepID=G4WH35_9PEZI|nr:reverse transcriptase [Ophiostoma torulosum]